MSDTEGKPPIHPAILTTESSESYTQPVLSESFTPPAPVESKRKVLRSRAIANKQVQIAKEKMQDAAILDHVVGKLSLIEVAHKYNTTPSAIKNWIIARQTRKIREELVRKIAAIDNKEAKAVIFNALLEGTSIPQIAKKYRLPVKKIRVLASSKEFKNRERKRVESYISAGPLHAGDGAGGRMTDEAVRSATHRLGNKIRALQTKLNMPTFSYVGVEHLNAALLEVYT